MQNNQACPEFSRRILPEQRRRSLAKALLKEPVLSLVEGSISMFQE